MIVIHNIFIISFLLDAFKNSFNPGLRESALLIKALETNANVFIIFFCYYLEGIQMHPKFCVMDDSYNYGSEFYGIEQNCVVTSLTERCFLSMWQATRLIKSVLVSGKANSGKTQTVKGLAQYFGKYLGYLYCAAQTDPQALGNFMIGLSQVLYLKKKKNIQIQFLYIGG